MYRTGSPQSFAVGAAVAKGRFVKLNSSGQVIHAAAVTDDCLGVALETGAAAGDIIAVAMIDGQTVVEVEGVEAIAIGELVGPTAVGKARDADTTGDRVLGTALSAISADGQFVNVLLQKQGLLVP